MQLTRHALAESIKQEILADMEARQEDMEQNRNRQSSLSQRYNEPPDYNTFFRNNPGRVDRERLKRELLMDLQEKAGEYHYSPPVHYRTPPAALNPLNPYDHAVLQDIKREAMAELEMRQAARHAEMYGYGHMVSDRNLNKMIGQRYRTLQNIREDLKKELEAIRAIENKTASITDPYVKEIASSVVTQAREQGVSLDEVLTRLDRQGGQKENLRQRASKMLNVGQRKGFLYGAGAAILAAMLYPSAKQSLHLLAVKTMEGGMDLADRTKSLVSRAKDGFEDIVTEANLRNFQGESTDGNHQANINTLEE